MWRPRGILIPNEPDGKHELSKFWVIYISNFYQLIAATVSEPEQQSEKPAVAKRPAFFIHRHIITDDY